MQVLWWLVPPLGATLLAMLWAGWAGRTRDDVKRDDSDEALARMQRALSRPTPQKGAIVTAALVEPTHGVAVRRTAAVPRPSSAADGRR